MDSEDYTVKSDLAGSLWLIVNGLYSEDYTVKSDLDDSLWLIVNGLDSEDYTVRVIWMIAYG